MKNDEKKVNKPDENGVELMEEELAQVTGGGKIITGGNGTPTIGCELIDDVKLNLKKAQPGQHNYLQLNKDDLQSKIDEILSKVEPCSGSTNVIIYSKDK